MRKYGIDNFCFEVIEECSEDELNEKEVFWIKYYDSFNRDKGYNMTPGGSEPIKINPQEIYDLWDKGLSVGDIALQLKDKMCYASVKKYLKDYEKWSKEESRKREGIKKANLLYEEDFCFKQYDLFGNFIANWNSIATISKTLNIPHNSISNAVKGVTKQTHGFQWRLKEKEDNSNINNIINEVPLHFEIIQKDMNDNIIGRYKTAKEAGLAVNTDPKNISRVCKHQRNRKTAKGFKWEYDFNTWYDPN